MINYKAYPLTNQESNDLLNRIFYLLPCYNPASILDPDPQCDPPPPPRKAGPQVTAKCYQCKNRSIGDLEGLKEAGWRDLELDYSSPASDPSYLGVCPDEICRSKM